jgi:hypothetical protein
VCRSMHNFAEDASENGPRRSVLHDDKSDLQVSNGQHHRRGLDQVDDDGVMTHEFAQYASLCMLPQQLLCDAAVAVTHFVFLCLSLWLGLSPLYSFTSIARQNYLQFGGTRGPYQFARCRVAPCGALSAVQREVVMEKHGASRVHNSSYGILSNQRV